MFIIFSDMFLPSPSDLLVNLNEARGLIHQLLEELPGMFKDTNETTSALGAALQVIFGTIKKCPKKCPKHCPQNYPKIIPKMKHYFCPGCSIAGNFWDNF